MNVQEARKLANEARGTASDLSAVFGDSDGGITLLLRCASAIDSLASQVERAREVEVLDVKPGDPWPEGITDGLALSCGVCGRAPHLDFTVSDACWDRVLRRIRDVSAGRGGD